MSKKNEVRTVCEGVEYPLVSGETTTLAWCPEAREGEPDALAAVQPWYSEKLDWYFDQEGTSGPGMEDHERRIDWSKVP